MSATYRDGTVKRKSKSAVASLTKWVGLAIVLVALVFFAWQYFARPKTSPSSSQEVTKAVSNLILLPNETPTVSTVNDNKLKSQPFFTNVEQGDKLLIYAKARKIIVYRPSTNKLINVGPILDDTTKTQSTSDSSSVNADDTTAKNSAADNK